MFIFECMENLQKSLEKKNIKKQKILTKKRWKKRQKRQKRCKNKEKRFT